MGNALRVINNINSELKNTGQRERVSDKKHEYFKKHPSI